MDLNGYFDPVSLERPEFEYLDHQESFSHNITVHTPDRPIRELDKHQIVLVGMPVDSNAFIKGSKNAPDVVRSKLYQLKKIPRGMKIYDLGNVKNGGSVNDSYFALRDIMIELRERDICTVILGGSQDLSKGVFMALEKEEGLQQVLTIDSMLDFSVDEQALNSRNYLNRIIGPELQDKFSYTNLGHQAFFVSDPQLKLLENSYQESIRLGVARANLKEAEPLVRDATFISVDLGAVRHGDAPGASIASPNGFTGDELCQLTRYAGLSEEVKIMGFFECNTDADFNGQTAHLSAQAAWYFMEGIANQVKENPARTPEHMKQFIVTLNTAGHDIIFHKSTLSQRWWMEIPEKNKAKGYNFFVSCSYEDYQQACKQDIPDRWWRFLRKTGNESG